MTHQETKGQEPASLFRSALYFGWVLVPISAILGMVAWAMASHGDPRNGHWWAIAGALSLLLPSTLGFVVASKLTGPRRSRRFSERPRWFPTTCGLVFCALALSGAVENSTDVAHRWVSARFDLILLPGSAFVWAVVGTLMVVAVDRLLAWRQSPPPGGE